MDFDKREAWRFGLGLSKVDGAEPPDWFLELVEKEIRGEITIDELEKIIIERCTVKET